MGQYLAWTAKAWDAKLGELHLDSDLNVDAKLKGQLRAFFLENSTAPADREMLFGNSPEEARAAILELLKPGEQLDPGLAEDFDELVARTADPGLKKVLERNKVKLVKNEVTSEKALQSLAQEDLESFDLSRAAAKALKVAFPTPTTAEPTSKRRRTDNSYQYLKDMLEPEVYPLPHITALPAFIATLPAHKLPADDTQYDMACVHPLAKQLLIPLSKVPDTFVLASLVSGVLRGELRDQAGENILHCDVDLLFQKWFKLAADATLLTFQSQRNTVDTLSGTTGKLLRPDYLLWVKNALLFKGEEKATAQELPVALDELLSKMTSTWDSRVYGNCGYMIAYAVAGNLLSIHAIQPGDRGTLIWQELIDVDMSTVGGKLTAMLAVVNILRLLRAMAKQLPTITWGIGQTITATDAGTTISTVTNMGSYVHKVVPCFKDSCGKYAPEGQDPLTFLKSVYASTKHAAHLVHALAEPKLRTDRFSVDLEPVGVAYRIPPQDVAEAKLAIKGVLQGCQELHAQGLVHRDVRWPNVVKVTKGDAHTIMLIDLELVGEAGMVCNAPPYPLRHWVDGDGGSVLESDGRYTALSDLRMVGKQLMGALAFDLGTSGRDLQEQLQRGQFVDAAAALTHEWLTT